MPHLRSVLALAALLALPAVSRAQASITDVRTKHATSGKATQMSDIWQSSWLVHDTMTYRPTPPSPNGTRLVWSTPAQAEVDGDGDEAGQASVQCLSVNLSISCTITAVGQVQTESSSGRSQARVTVSANNVSGSTSGTVENGNGYGFQTSSSYTSSFPASTLSLMARGNGVCGVQNDGTTLCAGTQRSSYQLGANLTPNSTTVGTTGTITITVSLPGLSRTMSLTSTWTVSR